MHDNDLVHYRRAATTPRARGVLDGAFRILRALSDTHGRGQVVQISQLTGLPRPTVYRLLAQLHQVGAVENIAGEYRVSLELADLTRLPQSARNFPAGAAQIMQALREQTGATVTLIVPTETSATALHVVPGREALAVDISVGREMPRQSAGVSVLRDNVAAVADQGDVYSDLTCYAAALILTEGRKAALSITTTARNPSIQYATITQQAAARIERLTRASGERRLARGSSAPCGHDEHPEMG